ERLSILENRLSLMQIFLTNWRSAITNLRSAIPGATNSTGGNDASRRHDEGITPNTRPYSGSNFAGRASRCGLETISGLFAEPGSNGLSSTSKRSRAGDSFHTPDGKRCGRTAREKVTHDITP